MNFIKPCEGRLTSPFGWRIHPISNKKSWHQGIDLAERGEVKIVASADGIVIRTGELGTYGNIVILRHNINGKLMETNYAHLHSDVVKVGQTVKQGQHIGWMGNTGSSTAQHLHFEIHNGKWATGQPNAVDPSLYTSFPEIKYLQEKLNDIGYELVEDGVNGSNTVNAVKDFQAKQKLTVDGNAGPSTLAQLLKVFALANAPKPEVKEVTPVIKPTPKPEPIVEPIVEPKTRYPDVGKNMRAYEAIENLSNLKIINGYTDGTFKPGAPVTRGDMAILMDRLYKAIKE